MSGRTAVRTFARTLALAIAAGACSDVPDDALDTDRPLTAEFVELFRVGDMDPPDWAQFGTPPSLGFDGRGNLFVLNPDAAVVAVVDRSGGLVRTLGRRGEGPGEFSGPDDIYVWRDGTVVVADRSRGSYVVFAPDGSFDRQVNMSAGQVADYGMMAFRSGARPDPGAVALVARGMSNVVQEQFRRIESPNPTIGPRGLERLTLGPAGTTPEPIVRAGEVRVPAPGEEASGAADEPRRFDPPLLFDVLPDGSVAYSDSAGYSIKLVAGDGAPIGTIARPLTPEPVTTEVETTVRDSAMAEFERLYGDPWEGAVGVIDVRNPVLTLHRRPAAGRSADARRIRPRWPGRLGRAGRTGRAEGCEVREGALGAGAEADFLGARIWVMRWSAGDDDRRGAAASGPTGSVDRVFR